MAARTVEWQGAASATSPGGTAMNVLSYFSAPWREGLLGVATLPCAKKKAGEKATIGHYTFTNYGDKMKSRI